MWLNFNLFHVIDEINFIVMEPRKEKTSGKFSTQVTESEEYIGSKILQVDSLENQLIAKHFERGNNYKRILRQRY